MKYNYWTPGELAVVKAEALSGPLSFRWASPAMRRIMRRHSRNCIKAVAWKIRTGRMNAEIPEASR